MDLTDLTSVVPNYGDLNPVNIIIASALAVISPCSFFLCVLLHLIIRGAKIQPAKQGWEFAHLISERIARFLSKNERMSDLLKK